MAAIARAVARGKLDARLKFVASDNPGAAGLDIARKMGFPAEMLDYGKEGRRGAEQQLALLCSRNNVEWIVLAGFMRLLSPEFVAARRGRIVNIHPSLLPSFPGRDGIGDAWRYGVKITGVRSIWWTKALIRPHPVPDGCSVRARDTLESLEKRIHRAEHGLYWKTLAGLFSGVPASERS